MEQLPAWNNSSEYKALNSADFLLDIQTSKDIIKEILLLNLDLETEHTTSNSTKLNSSFIEGLQLLSQKTEQALILLSNLLTYTNCEASLDAKNETAQKCASQLQQILASLESAASFRETFLKSCDETTLNAYLDSKDTRAESFYWKTSRKLKPFLLSQDEESLLAQFKPYSTHSWGDLYSQISGSLQVQLPTKGSCGLAQASGFLRNADQTLRKEAWLGIQSAWKSAEDSCAAVLNTLAGYRLEEYNKRSKQKKMHFLDSPLHEARIERETLEALLGAVQDRIDIPRRALGAMAGVLGQEKLEPWDILAPYPNDASPAYSFKDALAMISEAFFEIDPQMADFVQTMVTNNWIEARVMPNKLPGAYCTGFKKSKTPRVYQSFMGSMQDVSTLAHELGHAYHSWVMRDIAYAEKSYPMTLAETASTFAETLLSEKLFERSSGNAKLAVAWSNAMDASIMLINIPARFEFENSFYEARSNGPLSADELNQLTDKAWRKWYGDQITQTESQYWMTKLHFSIPDMSFYNFPYTFGYLFSLSIYALREKLGKNFHKSYVSLLRDTGRMSSEDLVKKHLGSDITTKEFWMESLDIVNQKVVEFENLVSK